MLADRQKIEQDMASGTMGGGSLPHHNPEISLRMAQQGAISVIENLLLRVMVTQQDY